MYIFFSTNLLPDTGDTCSTMLDKRLILHLGHDSYQNSSYQLKSHQLVQYNLTVQYLCLKYHSFHSIYILLLSRHPQTQHLFYIQLRRDIIEDRCQCNEEQALVLAGLALQAEYGDWHDKAKDAFLDHYLSRFILRRLGNSNAKDHLHTRHLKHQGMSDKQAELEYIKEMIILPEYGLHFYKVFPVRYCIFLYCILFGLLLFRSRF